MPRGNFKKNTKTAASKTSDPPVQSGTIDNRATLSSSSSSSTSLITNATDSSVTRLVDDSAPASVPELAITSAVDFRYSTQRNDPTLCSFLDLPSELREIVGRSLLCDDALRSLLNLSLSGRDVRQALLRCCYETVVLVYNIGCRKTMWDHKEGSMEFAAMKYIIMIDKPGLSEADKPFEIKGDQWPEYKSFLKWAEHDRETGKLLKECCRELTVTARHRPADLNRTLESIQYCQTTRNMEQQSEASARFILNVEVRRQVETPDRFEEARCHFPTKAYGLHEITVHAREDKMEFPTSTIAQLGGALALESWDTLLSIGEYFNWVDKAKVLSIIPDLISINPHSLHTSIEVWIDCALGESPTVSDFECLIERIKPIYESAIASVTRPVHFSFIIEEPSRDIIMARIYAESTSPATARVEMYWGRLGEGLADGLPEETVA